MEQIERKTAQTILQKKQTVSINGKEYEVEQPTIATLVMASEKIAELPEQVLNKENILSETIAIAPQCKQIAEVITIFILGAKRIQNEKKQGKIERIVNKLLRKEGNETFDEVCREIYYSATPSELNRVLSELIMTMEIGDFFALTTSLIGINLTKAKMTKTSQTAFGQ